MKSTAVSGESPELMQSAIKKVSAIVSEMSGIQLGDKQYPMVENRLKTRMARLGIGSFKEYLDFLQSQKEAESQALVSLLTTHHTFFFREFTHFEYMLNKTLPRIVPLARSRPDKTIHIWSAACSRGQEVYSLAMFFNFHLKHMAPDVKFKIWGTDIDPESVGIGKNGVYKSSELEQSPAMYLEGNWTRGKGEVADFSKVKSHLMSHCSFETANILNCSSFVANKMFDVIFCRNVFIYFNQDQIKEITGTLMKHLQPQGFLFLGVSESLNGLNIENELIGPSIYQHFQKESPKQKVEIAAKVALAKPKILEILSVDDSPTILALLGKVLTPDTGFKLAATAKNGRQAIEILKTRKFDAITLDLHMPELDGLGFLKEYQDRSAPVLVLSSINRQDTSIAQQALTLGASDYVEKVSLDTMATAGNEIRSKLKSLVQMKELTAPKKDAATSTATVSSTAVSSSTSKISSVVKSISEAKVTSKLTPIATSKKKIKVMIVDDSETIRTLLTKILSRDSKFEVVASADRPSKVEALIKEHKPDLLTLDIQMPEMDGVTLLKRIYPLYKIPTVMISSMSKEDGPHVLQALESGAVDYIQKPQMENLSEAANEIIERLKVAADSKPMTTKKARKVSTTVGASSGTDLIVIGASTGGVEALKVVLESMPAQIPPTLLVQHIPAGFSAAFAKRLNSLCEFEVREAKDGDEIKPNLVLLAPGGKQMGVKAQAGKLFAVVNDDALMNRHRPSVDYLFKSVADLKLKSVVAAVLTGMGADGARQLKTLRDQGARTLAQDEATSVVYGMPKEAARMGGAEFVVALDSVSQKLMELCHQNTKRDRKNSA